MLPQPPAAWTTSPRAVAPVTSRTGENLFWLGRYTERTEQLVRLARAVLLLIDTDEDAPETLRERACPSWRCTAAWRPGARRTLDQAPHLFERALLGALADARSPAALPSTWARWSEPHRRCASGCPTEQWGVMRSMGDAFVAGAARRCAGAHVPALGQVLPALDRLARAAGGRDRRADRPHDARPRLALA